MRLEIDCLLTSAKSGEGKTGKPFNLVELSNGLRSKAFFPRFDITDWVGDYPEGKNVTASFEVDVFKDSFNINLVALQ